MIPQNINPRIVLRIGGTRTRQGGFSALVSSGAFEPAMKEDNKMDRTPLLKEKPVVAIKHEQDYIVYSLIDCYVRSCDANTDGVLSLAIIIPRGFKLADGKSPYDLLMDIYSTYVSTYMEHASDGRDIYKDVSADRAIFDALLAQYPLERSTSPYIVMNPNGQVGTVMMDQDRISMVFRDSQYPEFQRFSNIEFGKQCPTTPGLERLEVPRQVKYNVYVNGKFYKTISNPNETVTTTVNPGNDYVCTNISFTINQLLNSPGFKIVEGKSSVTLDPFNCQIGCEIIATEKTYTIEFEISEKMTQDMQAKVINLINQRIINVKFVPTRGIIYSGSSTLASYAKKENFTIEPKELDNLKFEIYNVKRIEEGHILRICIDAKNNIVRASGSAGGSQGGRIGMSNGGGSPINPSNDGNINQIVNPVNTNRNGVSRVFPIVTLLLGLIAGCALGWWGQRKWTEMFPPELKTIGSLTIDSLKFVEEYNKSHPIPIDSLKIYNEYGGRLVQRELKEQSRRDEEQLKTQTKPKETSPSGSQSKAGKGEQLPPPPTYTKEEVMAQVLEWANRKNLDASERLKKIQGITGYKEALGQYDRTIIESVFKDHSKGRSVGLSSSQKKNIQRIQNRTFNSYEDLRKAQGEIAAIVDQKN